MCKERRKSTSLAFSPLEYEICRFITFVPFVKGFEIIALKVVIDVIRVLGDILQFAIASLLSLNYVIFFYSMILILLTNANKKSSKRRFLLESNDPFHLRKYWKFFSIFYKKNQYNLKLCGHLLCELFPKILQEPYVGHSRRYFG